MRVLIADDHQLFRDGLREVLRQFDDQVDIVEAGDFDQAVAAVSDGLDLVLLDLTMPGDTWENGVQRVATALSDGCRLIILSASDDPRQIRQSVALGAAGFIPKTASSRVMVSALRLVMEGGVYLPQSILAIAVEPPQSADCTGGSLTPRQRDVLAVLSQGKSNKEIARVLDIAEGTVKLHVTAILKALGVNSRTRAVVVASQLGVTA